MTRFSQVFWAITAIDATLLIVFLVMAPQQRSVQNDGSREMGIFYFIILPCCVLALAMLLFHFSASLPAKWVALFIVAAPGLYFAKSQIEHRIVERRMEADQLGVGYFDTEPMRQMGAAVVKHDVETLMRVGPSVDVNAPGRDNMTLMRMALSSADTRRSNGSEMPVVRALLALGALPEDAMPTACIRFDSELLEILLAAGGNPNLNTGDRDPLVFGTMNSITPRNFRLLAQHGLNLNSKSRNDDPLPVQLAIYRRWDLLAIALELGADITLARKDGRNVAGELAGQIDEKTKAGGELPADLMLASALLEASRAHRRDADKTATP
nr:hypothetical protein [Rhodoferax sp.]